jgi:hypothetical protein
MLTGSRPFSAYSDIMTLALMAYNLLRLCGQESLREDNGNLEKRASHRDACHLQMKAAGSGVRF